MVLPKVIDLGAEIHVLFSALDLVALVLQGVNVNREDRVYE